jgi:hypothetical protein
MGSIAKVGGSGPWVLGPLGARDLLVVETAELGAKRVS